MSEKVGSVYIEASIDTTGVIAAGKSIATATDKIDRDLQGVGTAATNATMQLTKTAQAVKGAGAAFGGMGRYAQGVGYQLQDIAVQAQMGTSAFTILGQQGSQIASLFGPGGAVFGAVLAISAAIGGTLVASIKKAEDEVEKLPDNVQKRIEAIGKKFEEVDFSNRADLARSELGKLNVEYDRTQETIEQLSAQLKDLDAYGPSSKFVTGGKQYQKVWYETSLALKKTKAEMADLQLVIEGVNKKTTEGLAGKSLDDVENKIGKSKDAAEGLAAQIQAATLRLTEGELAARRFAAAQVIGLQAGEQLPPELDKAILKLYELEQAQLRDTEAAKERVKQAAELEKTLERIRQGEAKAEEQFAKERAAEDKKYADERARLAAEVQNVGLTDDQVTANRYAKELELLKQANEQKLLSDQEYLERKAQLEKQYQGGGTGLFETVTASLANLQDQATGTFAQMALGFGDSEDLARQLGRTIVTQLIGSVINWGIQQAIAAATGAAATVAAEGTKTAAIVGTSTAAATAGASAMGVATGAAVTSGAAITAAMAPAAAASSVATAGASAASGATIALSSIAAILGALTIGSAMKGGKLYGGPVQAGGMYPITEDGRPEILQQGNKQYLLPGNSGGQVISNRDMQAGGEGGLNVYVTSSVNVSQIDSSNSQQWIAQYAAEISNAVDATARRYGRGQR